MTKYKIADIKKTEKGRHKYNGMKKSEWEKAYRDYQENFYRDFDPKDMRPPSMIPIAKPPRTEEYYASIGKPLVYERYEGVPDNDIVEYETRGSAGKVTGVELMTAAKARKKGYERALKVAYQNEIGHNGIKGKLGASVGHRLICDMPMQRRIARLEGIPHTQVPKSIVTKIERKYKEMAKNNPALPQEKSSPVINKVFSDDGALMRNMNGMVMQGLKNQGKLMSYPTAEDLQMECQKFLLYCEEKQIAPTVPMMNVWLGLSNAQYKKYLSLGNDHSAVLEFMNQYMHAFTLDKAMNGHVHHVLYVYLSKNWWDMSDKVEQTITTVNTGMDMSDKDVVMNSLKDLPIVDVDFEEDDDDWE